MRVRGSVERAEFGAPEPAGQAFGSPTPRQGPADLLKFMFRSGPFMP